MRPGASNRRSTSAGSATYPHGKPPRSIKGLYADVRQTGLERDVGPQLILPFEDEVPQQFAVLVAGERNRVSLRDLERAIWDVDSTLTVQSSMLLSQRLSQELAPKLLQSGLFTLVMLVALCIVAICVYGLVWTSVERSKHELAVRMAVGATLASLRRRVVLRFAGWWVFGAVTGAVITAVVWMWLRSVVSELQTASAAALLIAIVISLCATLSAAWLGPGKLKSVTISETLKTT